MTENFELDLSDVLQQLGEEQEALQILETRKLLEPSLISAIM